ncbi:MAG: glycosyltransferase family 2 protein [Gemmataceae bacterium]
MSAPPHLSLIVPTRGRPGPLQRFLDSIASTTALPDQLEIVLVRDEDDPLGEVKFPPGLRIVHSVGPAGRRMGELNQAGYRASSGRFVMLLNDDVLARTLGWDRCIYQHLASMPDEVVLIHVNDTLLRRHLCTFPLLSRFVCEQAGGICPEIYERYRIDDHIEDVFNLLAALGERRILHLPEVIFEHLNATPSVEGVREYQSDPEILQRDAPRFDALFGQRKALALQLLGHIEKRRLAATLEMKTRQLAHLSNPLALRTPARQRVELDDRPAPDSPVTLLTLGRARRSRRCSSHHPSLVVSCDYPTPAALNRALLACQTDLVVVVLDPTRLTQQSVPALLDGLSSRTGVVLPGSGATSAPEVYLPPPYFLVDRLRCRNLLFEEHYGRYFFVADFALRVQRAGLGVTQLDALPSRAHRSGSVDLAMFQADRERFLTAWPGSNEAGLIRTMTERLTPLRPPFDLLGRAGSLVGRLRACYRRAGWTGLGTALWRRLTPLEQRSA